MARHLGDHSLFLWGQRYKGTPEVFLTSAAFRVAGPTVVVLKAVTLACFVAFLCLNFRLLEKTFSRRIAWVATAFFIAGPPALVLWTLTGSAEMVMTWLAGAVLLLGVMSWLRTGSRRGELVAAAALGFGLWVQQYIVYYVVTLVVTAAVIRPDWRVTAIGVVRDRPRWLRVVIALLLAVCALYTVFGVIAFFTAGVDVVVAGVHITITRAEKMWWIAGTLLIAAFAAVVISIRQRQLVAPALAFLAGYSPALIGRIGSRDMGAPISTLDFHGLVSAWPGITGVMLPMLLGFRDPMTRRTIYMPLVLSLLAVAIWSYLAVRRRRMSPFFHVLPVVAIAMFFVSGSYIDPQSYRYLMPAYAALPVVFAVGVDDVWTRSKPSGFVLLAFMLALFASQQIAWYQRLVPDVASAQTIACLDRAGIRAARAPYWQSYTITFLTGERIIVSPTDGVDRYAPYGDLTRTSPTIADAGCVNGK